MPPSLQTTQITVVYGEKDLQTTFRIANNTSTDAAKQIAIREIRQQLEKQEVKGVPRVSIDPSCTDFYPAPPSGSSTVGSLKSDITVIVWPAEDPSTGLTPSPLVDAFAGTTSELKELRAQKAAESLINESITSPGERKKHGKQNKAKQQNPSTGNDSTKQPMDGGSSLEAIMLRLSAMETEFIELKKENAAMEKKISDQGHEISDQGHEISDQGQKISDQGHEIMELKKENADLRSEIATTMQAVNGDKIAINKIRQRVLLDFARDKLAVLCGFQDWNAWTNLHARKSMAAFAKATLSKNANLSQPWKEVAEHRTALDFIISPNPIRLQGNRAAHTSSENMIAESILSLPDGSQKRDIMKLIFTACYGEDPAVKFNQPSF